MRKLREFPRGHTIVTINDPHRGIIHMAVWFVRVPEKLAYFTLRKDGLREVRSGTLRWRPVAEVADNVGTFPTYVPHAQVIRRAEAYADFLPAN